MVQPPANAIVMMQRAVALAAQPVARRALDDAAARRSVRVLPVPAAAGRLSIFDFKATRRLIDESYTLTTAWLEHKSYQPAGETRVPNEPRLERSVGPAYGGAVA